MDPTILAALIGVGGSVIGGFVGASLERKGQVKREQREAVAEFLKVYNDLAQREIEGDFYRVAGAQAVETYTDGTQRPRATREYVRKSMRPLLDRFTTAHDVLQLSLHDKKVARSAQHFYDRHLILFKTAAADRLAAALNPYAVMASIFSGGHVEGPEMLVGVAKKRLS